MRAMGKAGPQLRVKARDLSEFISIILQPTTPEKRHVRASSALSRRRSVAPSLRTADMSIKLQNAGNLPSNCPVRSPRQVDREKTAGRVRPQAIYHTEPDIELAQEGAGG